MASDDFKRKLFEIEDRHGIYLCVHEWLNCGRVDLTVYRVIEDEKDRNLPIPKAVIDDLEPLLNSEYANNRPSFLQRFFQTEEAHEAHYKISPTGLTTAEIQKNQQSWNNHCDLVNACY